MIARLRLGRNPSRPLSYLTNAKSADATEPALPRLTAVRCFGLGLDGVDADWQGAVDTRNQTYEIAAIAIRVLAAHRPDLKHRVAHLILSADPRWASTRTRMEVRRAYDRILTAIQAEIGLQDRCGVAVLHADGHSKWRAHEPLETIEHLHAVVALPHPDTLRSISAHRLQARTARACRDAWRRLNAPSAFADATHAPAATPIPEPDLDEVLRSISRQERERRRQRDRGVER